MATHDYDNQASQAERREVLRDTYLNRAQSDADLAAQGRFKKETTTRVTGVPQYPQLPPSSPWSNGFDTNLEPPLGIAEMPEPVPIPVTASPTKVDRTEEPVIGSTVAHFPAMDEPMAGSRSIKRRVW